MESQAPDPAARLLTVVEAVAARAEEARRRLDELSATLDDLAGRIDGAPAAAPGDAATTTAPASPSRLAAIEMAVSGASRAQAAERLSVQFPGADLAPVLDDVYGPAR
jgi:hypothetical protein